MTTMRQRMIEDMRVRNLSLNTQRIYVERVAKYAYHFGKSAEKISVAFRQSAAFPSLSRVCPWISDKIPSCELSGILY
jgi:hypothetical protein